MKKILSAAALAVAFAVSAGAQTTTPSSQETQPSTDKKAAKAASKSVTLTGCLREGDTPNSFALENAQMSPSDRASISHPPTSTSGTASSGSTPSGSTSASGSGSSSAMSGTSGSDLGAVKLSTTADIDLKAHIGHRVQVTGTMSGDKMKDKSSPSSSDTMGSGSAASPSSAAGSAGAAKDKAGHSLRVRAIRHVSETCS